MYSVLHTIVTKPYLIFKIYLLLSPLGINIHIHFENTPNVKRLEKQFYKTNISPGSHLTSNSANFLFLSVGPFAKH